MKAFPGLFHGFPRFISWLSLLKESCSSTKRIAIKKKLIYISHKKVKKDDHQLKPGKLIWSDPPCWCCRYEAFPSLTWPDYLPPPSNHLPAVNLTPPSLPSAPIMVLAFAFSSAPSILSASVTFSLAGRGE